MKTVKTEVKSNKNSELAKGKNQEQKNTPKIEKSNSKVSDILNQTAESRIKKLENMQVLAEKHAFLTEKKEELEKFILSNDGTKESIILENARGFKMTISNSQVVEDVTEHVSKMLNSHVEKCEKDILNYQI